MTDRETLRSTVEGVEDPFLRRTLGELGLVVDAETRRLGADKVRLRVPVPGHPLFPTLLDRVRQAVGRSVEVETVPMTDEERAELMAGLRAKAGPPVGEPGSRTRVVAVSSGKGGVGKSSVTTNLAVALVARGHTVGVVDADIWGFSVPRMLGITYPPAVVGQSIIPPEAHGVRAMSMDYFVDEDTAVIWRGPMLHKAIEQFLKDVWWDDPDFLLVDMPPGTGDVSISLSQFLPRAQVLIVTTPQPTAQRVARRAALMAAQVEQEVIGVVENMSWFTGDDGTRYRIFGEGGGAALAAELEVPLMASVPLLPAMREGADDSLPVVLAAPGSEAAAAFDALADAVVAKKPRVRHHPKLVIR